MSTRSKAVANVLTQFIGKHPDIYGLEAPDLLGIFARYASGGFAALTLSEREKVRGIYADRFFNLVG